MQYDNSISLVWYLIGASLGLFALASVVLGICLLATKNKPCCPKVIPWIAIPFAVFGLLVLSAYGMEAFIAFYGGNKFEADAFHIRLISGPYRWFYYASIACLLTTQLLWIPKLRKLPWFLIIIGALQHFEWLLMKILSLV